MNIMKYQSGLVQQLFYELNQDIDQEFISNHFSRIHAIYQFQANSNPKYSFIRISRIITIKGIITQVIDKKKTIMEQPSEFSNSSQPPATRCNCSKSKCSSKYCPCFKSRVKCTIECGCRSCQNGDLRKTLQPSSSSELQGWQVNEGAKPQHTPSRPSLCDEKLENTNSKQFMKPHLIKNRDPLFQAEQRALDLRKVHRTKKLQDIRSKAFPGLSGKNLNLKKKLLILLLNVRGLNSELKKQQVINHIQRKRPDYAGLTETRLKATFKVKDSHPIQTVPGQKGGVWAASFSSKQTKNIKYIGNAMAYQSVAYHQCPIHFITCYLSPVGDDAVKVRSTIQHLKSMVHNIFANFANSKVVVMGDFNQRWRIEVESYLRSLGLLPILPPDISTHELGGQLDQVFSNLPCTARRVQQVAFSDHMSLEIELEFKKGPNDLDLSHIPTVMSQKNIRIATTSQDMCQALIQNPELLNRPAIEIVRDKIQKTKTISSWYKPPPKWFLTKEPLGEVSLKTQRDQEWAKLMKQIEVAYELSDMKKFHSLVNRACKIHQTGQPIEGLIVGEQHITNRTELAQHVVHYYQKLYGNINPTPKVSTSISDWT